MIRFLVLSLVILSAPIHLRGASVVAGAPTNWIGYGAGYSQGKAQITLSYASQLSSAAGIWSYTSADYQKPTGSPVVSSLRTGLFIVMRQIGNFTIGETIEAGGSTELSKSGLNGAVSDGLLGLYRFRSGWTVSVDAHALKVANNGTGVVYTLLMGKSW